MRARFINEDIRDVLKGKSEEDIAKSMSKIRNVNRIFRDGQTRLHMASKQGQTNIVKSLIQSGADINIKDAYRATPIMYAKTPEIIDIFKEAGDTTPYENIFEFIIKRDIHDEDVTLKLIDYFLKKGAKINLNYALYMASSFSPKLIKSLVDKGANINYIDRHGQNLLMHVILMSFYGEDNKRIEIIKTLIDNGINVNYINKSPDLNSFGQDLKRHPTAMDYTIRYMNNLSESEKIQIAKLLMDAGFKVSNVKSKYDQQDINKFLRKHKIIKSKGDNKKQEIIEALDDENKTLLKDLLQNGSGDIVWESDFNDMTTKGIDESLVYVIGADRNNLKVKSVLSGKTFNVSFDDVIEYGHYHIMEDTKNIKSFIKDIEKEVDELQQSINELDKGLKKLKSFFKKLK